MSKTSEELEIVFAALADRTRLRLLNLMTEGEVCVCYFVEILGEPQPKISRHLAFLRRAALVSARRDGKWMHYALAIPPHPAAGLIVERVLSALRDDAEMSRDRADLARVYCPIAKPERGEASIFFFE